MAELLRAESISKIFPGVKALDNVNLLVESGKVLGLLGENGAGKSTLLNVLSGIYQPDGGRIYVEGQEGDRQRRPAGSGRRRRSYLHRWYRWCDGCDQSHPGRQH